MVRSSEGVQMPTALSAYFAPVNPSMFPTLWITLMALGIAALGWFFVYEVTVSKKKRSLVKEVSLAGLASMLLGFGVLFLLLWAGVWV